MILLVSNPRCSHSVSLPVLDLYEVGDEAVGGTALDKVPLCREEDLRLMAAKLLLEVVEE